MMARASAVPESMGSSAVMRKGGRWSTPEPGGVRGPAYGLRQASRPRWI
jgi:hypothetical protein